MPWLIPLLNAIAAIPVLVNYLNQAVQTIIVWYVGKQKQDTLAQIADAAAWSARANSDDERYAAAQKWREALSRPRSVL